ncbi:HAD family hydrolase [Candidatus Bathycorpusculum sp.]|jgi:HAD superfamily hydrolase (TIGR01549 family)|uniref:HAD family hydrolase n=1 Tax=Candidatus Bathycorpusculum sp. TaxID=2994959 RepID=UPI00282E03E6|nr:HAD family hydrolase [Candidatus Termitimicrobium sp.]MCL2431931.1 HAD family hydrolase [Candidatus Termitimicrobium sp.]MDR0471492.1 HAD family hydrolase [Nitrososphaerota archaeon]
MDIEAVIFDLDGTLVAFSLDYKALRGEVREYLLRIGVPLSVLHVNEGVFDMLQNAEIYFKNNGKSEVFCEARMQSLAIVQKYEKDAAAVTSLMPGALETLKELKEMKIKLGLCTISSKTTTDYLLDRFKIKDYFEISVTRDGVKRVKPDTEQHESVIETLGVRPEAVLVVGDSVVDMQSAKALKIIAVGLPTGISTKEQLIKNGANYIITSLIDLPGLIKNIEKN